MAQSAFKSESCGLCITLPSVVGDAGVALTHGNYLREAARNERILREYERLTPTTAPYTDAASALLFGGCHRDLD